MNVSRVLFAARYSGAAAVMAIACVAASGCDAIFGYTVALRFDNRTDSRLCLYFSEPTSNAQCIDEIDADGVTRWTPECGRRQQLSIVLTVAETGERIYSRAETCGDWNETDRTFVIEERDGEFVVTGPE